MRGLAGTLAVMLSGCLVQNPAYDEGTASASGSGGSTGSTSGASTTALPTSGTGDGSGTAGESTGGDVTTDPVVTSEPTGGATGSTGEVGSTGEPAPVCKAKEELPLAVVPLDTGVVPATMGMPCPWGGAVGCEGLNFGVTQFYRLVNDGMAGRNAALIQFPRDQVMQEILAAGYSIDDLVGVRLEFVVWEQIKMPLDLIELQIDLLNAGDSVWVAGGRDAAPAIGVEPSFACRQTDGCATWSSMGGPLASATPLGSLYVDPLDHPALDKDQPDETQYHMQIRSELLPGAPIRDRLAEDGLSPAFAVSLKSLRGLGQQTFGIKLSEAPWDGPTLWVELCQQ